MAFFGDLLSLALMALILSTPLLIAFGSFLTEAAVGGHQGEGYSDTYVPSLGLIAYLLPYVYGPIFAAPQQVGNAFWFNIGGYSGVMPFLLGMAGLVSGFRRPICWLLAGWVFIAIGVSHGMPGLHAAFMRFPLAKITLYGRYLDASWIFCCVVLSAMFIDQLPQLGPVGRRRAGYIAGAAFVLALAGALVPAWPPLTALWRARHGGRIYIVLSLAAAFGLLAGFLLSLRRQDTATGQRALTALAAVEALAAFLMPFGSYPRIAGIDLELIEFLRRHAGMQRVAVAPRTGLMPNFGSAFGFPLLNYDDLPVPARTADYVYQRLDPLGNPMLFRPDGRTESLAEREISRELFISRLPAYAAAGVRYLLAEPDFFAAPAYGLEAGVTVPEPLAPDQELTLTIRKSGGGGASRCAGSW